MSVRERHPLAGRVVRLNVKNKKIEGLDGAEFRIEDWCQNVIGRSWMAAYGNPAALAYALRAGFDGLPTDDDVVYGKIGSLGYLVHQSEIVEPEASVA